MINFPSSPGVGQIFGKYIFNGQTWNMVNVTTASPKNYIINPSFQVSQQNASTPSSASGYYIADQWQVQFSGASTISHASERVGFPWYGRIWSSGAYTPVAGAYAIFMHGIEGQRIADLRWGTAAATPVVLSLKARSVGFSPFVFSVYLRNASNARSFVHNFTITATSTWQTFTVLIPGCIDGTWPYDNTLAATIGASAMCSTTFQGTVDAWQASNLLAGTGIGNLFTAASIGLDIADVGLYADPYSTGVAPEFETPEPFSEQRRCQRYWTRMFGLHGGVNSATGCNRMAATLPVVMRATPSAAIVGAPKIFDMSVTPTITGLTSLCNRYAAEFDMTTSGGMTPGRPAQMYSFGNEADYIAMSARMS